jgi:hypothetical protein
MIRLISPSGATSTRTLTESQFISEVLGWAERSFALAPPGAITIESLDELQRVRWRAYCQRARELLRVARQICDERALQDDAERAGTSTADRS